LLRSLDAPRPHLLVTAWSTRGRCQHNRAGEQAPIGSALRGVTIPDPPAHAPVHPAFGGHGRGLTALGHPGSGPNPASPRDIRPHGGSRDSDWPSGSRTWVPERGCNQL